MNYHFGKTSFSNYVWVKGGQLFNDPNGLDIEMISTGAFRLEIHTPGGIAHTYRKKGTRAGWTSFYFNGSGVDDYGNVIPPLQGDYKFKLVNESAGTRQALQGSLDY